MGKLINGINGPVRGKVGTVIGSSWKGIPYLKAHNPTRSGPVSKKETANRQKFKAAQLWLKPLLVFVRQGFKGFNELSEGFVAAKSCLLLQAFEQTPDGWVINPALARVSSGDLPLSEEMSVLKVGDGQLQFTWNPSTAAGAGADDQLMMLAYDIENSKAFFVITGQFRKNGSDILRISSQAGRTYHLYAAFLAADRSRQSDSVYLGTVTT